MDQLCLAWPRRAATRGAGSTHGAMRAALAAALALASVACGAGVDPQANAALSGDGAGGAGDSNGVAGADGAGDGGGSAGTADSETGASGDAADSGSTDAGTDSAGAAIEDADAATDSPDADAGVDTAGCAEGAACDDGDACTVSDHCVGGACVAGGPLQCNGNACSAASCDPAKGCVFTDLSAACDDGSACTTGDACQGGICQGKVLVCGDGNACTSDGCDLVKGCTATTEPDDSPCGAKSVCLGGACVVTGTIFAHSSDKLYRLELKSKSFVLVGSFTFNKNAGQVTDVAIDRKDALFAITFGDLFTCKTNNAACTWIMTLPQSFNGMTFVHGGTIYPEQDALIGIANSGGWYHVQYDATPPKVVQLGSYGLGYGSSGDAFSVKGVGTFATVTKVGSFSDLLVEVDPKTGKVQKEVGATGVSGLWGVAWWEGVAYGFASGGAVYQLDLQTGKATTLSGFALPAAGWWGAGVSTEAAN